MKIRLVSDMRTFPARYRDLTEVHSTAREALMKFFPDNEIYQLMFRGGQFRRLYVALSDHTDSMRDRARQQYAANPKGKDAQNQKDVTFVFCAAVDQFLIKELVLLSAQQEERPTASMTLAAP